MGDPGGESMCSKALEELGDAWKSAMIAESIAHLPSLKINHLCRAAEDLSLNLRADCLWAIMA